MNVQSVATLPSLFNGTGIPVAMSPFFGVKMPATPVTHRIGQYNAPINMLPHPPPTGLTRGFDARFSPGVGNLTVKSLMLPRGSIEMYTGFDTLALPL